MQGLYRQGDILFVPIGNTRLAGLEIIKRWRESPVIAEGEATGHKHQVKQEDFDEKKARIVEFDDPEEVLDAIEVLMAVHDVEIVHDEHLPVAIPAGTYQIVRQQEVDPLSVQWRTVSD